MNKLIIGIDPDSVKNGVALYEKGKLGALHNFTTIQFYLFCEEFSDDIDSVHLENVNGNRCSSFGYRAIELANKGKPKRVVDAIKAKYSESVGKCKHAQQEIERICEHFKIKVVLHAVSSKWKNAAGKKEFERVTGWSGRSNEDQRSAAYFGYIGSR